MIEKGKYGKILVYLDQFAVSNMLEAKEGSLWYEIKIKLIKHIEEEKMLCPLSIEHYFETSQKMCDNAKLHELFFQSISGGYIFMDLSTIVANQINILIRKCDKVSIDTFLHLNYLNLLDDKTYHNINVEFGAFKKESNDDYKLFNEKYKDEGIYDVLKKHGQNGQIKLLEMMEKTNVDNFVKYIKKNINDLSNGDLNIRDSSSIVVHKLLTDHHFTENDLILLVNELETNGYENIESFYIHNKLIYLSSINRRKLEFNDQIDIDRISIGLPYCDYLFCDYKHKNEILQLQLNEKFNTEIFTAKQEDLESFLELVSD